MEIYVELGLTPMQAIGSATRHGAGASGKENELGTLKAGKLADIIIVDGNPLEHIRNLADPSWCSKTESDISSQLCIKA